MEDRRRRQHKRTALAKLRDALWGGLFLCPNFCIAWMQKRLLNLALKVSITVLLIEYSSTESATFSPPSQWMMGAIFITNKPKKYVFIQLPFHLAKGNGISLGPRRNAWPNLASPSTQFDSDRATCPSNPRFGVHEAGAAKLEPRDAAPGSGPRAVIQTVIQNRVLVDRCEPLPQLKLIAASVWKRDI